MKKVLLKIGKFFVSTLNILLNPLYSLMSITQKKRDHDENENKLSYTLFKIFRSTYMIFFISALLTVLIILSIHHKELLGI